MSWIAPVAMAGASILGGVLQSNAADKASSQQVQAQGQSTALQQNIFDTTQGNLAPFREGGTYAYGNLLPLIGGQPGGNPLTAALTAPFSTVGLENTPGYKFTLEQGLQALQNGYAAQGLGTSGAAVKGAENYAQNLAGTLYQNMFDNYLKGNLQTYNMLMGPVGLGESAGASQGNLGATIGGNISSGLVGQGNAAAAGTIGSASNIAGGISSGVNNGFQGYLLQQLLNRNSGTATSSTNAGGSGGLFNFSFSNPQGQ